VLASVSLDSTGRWILREIDYRYYGLLIAAILVVFTVWRRWSYKSWPSKGDLEKLVIGLLAIIAGLNVGIVFLMTKPPAVDALSGTALVSIGLITLIGSLAYGAPLLWALFFPPQVPPPPDQDKHADQKLQ
jgi:hypothetical protein